MKKFCKQKEVCYFSDSGGLTLKKMLRMARFTVFCFFLGLIQVMAIDTYSQQTRLSVNYQNESLENVLRAIEKESEFFFLYNRDLIDVDHNVTISADNQLIKGILDELFSGTDIRYAIFDRQIVLSNKEAISEMTAQQQKSVTGKVTNTSGEPLPGVTVVVKGTTTGIVSSVDGTFTISNIPPDASLVFSFVGMKLQEIAIGNKTVINVVMEEETVGIGEVVAIGYGTVKKSSVTAAVAKLTNEGLNQIAVGRADLTLIGQLPGISVRQASTRPGDAPVIRIRGVSSITGVNDPLYVVDGVPINGDLNSVNAGDIESIEVLKDASSAAIYGSRAAAGVVMITTKRGTGQKPSFNIGSYFGVRTPTYLVKDYHNARDAFDYAVKFTNYNYINSGGNPSVPVYQRPAAYRPDSLYLKLGDTDWQKELLRNALMQNHEISSSGGTDRIKYYISANYMDEQSTFIVGEYKRYSARANVDVKISNKFDLGITFNPTYSVQKRQAAGNMGDLTKYPPYIPVYLPNNGIAKDGSRYAGTLDFFTNPYIKGKNPVANVLGTHDTYYRFMGFGNIFLNYEIIKNLKFKTSLAFDYQTVRNPYFMTMYAQKDSKTDANIEYSENLNSLNENILSYNTSVNQHSFNVIAGNTFQRNKNFYMNMSVTLGSIPNDKIETLNAGVVNNGKTFMTEWGLISYFGRINYAYADKYLFSVSYRRDGSSRFGKDRRWGAFPSASVGWRVTQEKFMQNQKFISNLKLRLSYGLTGRTPSGFYDAIPSIQNFNYTLGTGSGVKVVGATQGTFGNTELGWEKTKELDFGIDLGILEGRITLETDLYKRLTTDLLLANPIPGINGFTTTTTNLGKVSNKGIEFSLNTRNLIGAFKWETRLNYSKNINRVEELGDMTQLPLVTSSKGMWFLTQVGKPIGLFYGYKQTGVWQSTAEIAANPSFPGVKPGSIRVADMNDDKIINQLDRTILGSNMPDFEFGITNNLSYKNFDLSVLVNGVIGFDVWNMELSYYRENRHYVTDYQWFSAEDPGNGWCPTTRDGIDPADTDFYIEDGSYWSIRNMTLGYTIDKNRVKGNLFKSARIYVAVQNLYMHISKDFHAYNPEGLTESQSDATRPGINFGSEPLNRTYTLGINLGF
jgi:TonB-linked SusC/RagA family outer membrane protein